MDEGKLVLKTKGYHHVTRFSEDDVNLDAVVCFGAPGLVECILIGMKYYPVIWGLDIISHYPGWVGDKLINPMVGF